jgi:hypothetical protein
LLLADERALRERSGERPDPGGGGLRRVAERRRRDEAAGINGIDRDVRSHGRIYRGAELRLVVGAVQTQAAAEVHQRLQLRQRTKAGHRRLQRRQLPVGRKHVERVVVLAERAAEIGDGSLVAVMSGLAELLNDGQ